MIDRTDPGGVDRMLSALGHPDRRRVLFLLRDGVSSGGEGAEFSVDDLATDDDPERVETRLYHAHLPKLAEAGYVEWDPATLTFSRGSNFDDVAPLVRLLDDHRDQLPGDWR